MSAPTVVAAEPAPGVMPPMAVAGRAGPRVAQHLVIASGKNDRLPGFQAALTRCRPFRAALVAARLGRITTPGHTLSGRLEGGYQICAAEMPGAGCLMMRIYAAMAQKERELISERTRAALAAAKARGRVLGGDRGYRPSVGPDSGAAAVARREAASLAAHRLLMDVDAVRQAGQG